MTENYYMTQQLLPFYFKSQKNKEFFYKVIGPNPQNIEIFFTKELYGWVKEDIYIMEKQDKTAKVPEEEKIWKYQPIKSAQDMSDNKEWVLIFVKFAPDFVKEDLDAISVVIAMKGNPEDLEIKLFILERGSNFDGSPAFYVCGRDIENDKHLNFGQIDVDEKFMQNFREKILSTLERK